MSVPRSFPALVIVLTILACSTLAQEPAATPHAADGHVNLNGVWGAPAPAASGQADRFHQVPVPGSRGEPGEQGRVSRFR